MLRLILFLFVTIGISGSLVIDLNKDNYDEATAGKNVFIKFFDPNCEHCKSMVNEWDKMAKDWNEHDLVLIAQVNCRADVATERWCRNDMNIHGMPTLLYGEPSHGGLYLDSYGDDKVYDVLTRFVRETLSQKPICTAGNIRACEPDVQDKLKTYWKASKSDLEAMIDAKKADIKAAHTSFKSSFAEMQSLYDQRAMEHESLKAQVRTNIQMIRSVIAWKKKSNVVN